MSDHVVHLKSDECCSLVYTSLPLRVAGDVPASSRHALALALLTLPPSRGCSGFTLFAGKAGVAPPAAAMVLTATQPLAHDAVQWGFVTAGRGVRANLADILPVELSSLGRLCSRYCNVHCDSDVSSPLR